MDRDFKGVWIPKEIWINNDLGWTEKILLVEIDSLVKLGECYATNEYFAEFFDLSKDRISKLISSLIKKGYIESRISYKKGTKQVEKRVITTIGHRRKQLEGIGENNYTPIGENAEDNNTSTNITFNNISVDKPHTHKFYQPSIDEVKAYCRERNKGLDAEKWYDFYEAKGWMIGKNKMKDWKAAVRTWEKNNSSQPKEEFKVKMFEF